MLDALIELSYKTAPENDYVSGFYEKTDEDNGNSVEEMQAAFDDLEAQRKQLKLKIADLELSAQHIEQEQQRIKNSLGSLFRDESKDRTKLGDDGYFSNVAAAPLVTSELRKRASDKDGSVTTQDESRPREYALTGEVIGDGKYLLVGKPKQTTSGRSFLWTAYRKSEDGSPMGDELAVKISSDVEAMKHEHENYLLLQEREREQMFVKQHDFFPVYGDTLEIGGESIPMDTKMALVMERGREDLQAHIIKTGHGMNERTLKRIGMLALRCLQDLHAVGLVWTDLKTQNFVIFQNGDAEDTVTIKGIDLESCRPVKGHPIDYCPEACPPEMARACLLGHESNFVLEFDYDIWSFGMFLYELITGKGFYYGKPRTYIVRMLGGALPGYKPSLDDIPNEKLADLIDRCLQSDPSKRPSLSEILEHPYFAE